MGIITIQIHTDSEAFEDAGGSEVARILRALADTYDESGFYVYARILDSNGSTVGATAFSDKD